MYLAGTKISAVDPMNSVLSFIRRKQFRFLIEPSQKTFPLYSYIRILQYCLSLRRHFSNYLRLIKASDEISAGI